MEQWSSTGAEAHGEQWRSTKAEGHGANANASVKSSCNDGIFVGVGHATERRNVG